MEQNRRHRNQLPSNIPQLQNLIKRDPSAYREEFMQQYHHYQSLRQLLFVTPAQDSSHLGEIVMFLAQVTPCYPEAMANFPVELKQLLHTHSTVLHPNVRMTLCRALILLRNKGVIEPDLRHFNDVVFQSVLELFFALFHCQDKALRVMLYSHILADIKRINAKHKNMKVNTTLQNFMYTMLSDSGKVAARMSLDLIIELYKKNIWRDARTVNVLATVCLSPVTKMMGIALQFFLTGEEEDGTDAESESSDESDAESQALRDIVISRQTVKSGRKRERKVARARAILKKQCKKRKVPPEARFMALHLIHDPQDFADKLFQCLEKATVKFELRLMMMALISRLIGVHQLFVLNFYPFLQRYLQPHQKEVTKIMTYLAQASHDLVPPEVLEPIIKAVTNNFITERNSSDAIAMGLNAVREVCVRCPLVMSRELLADLAGYKTYRDKGVVMAARSLIQLYRNVRPELLQRKDRGQPMEIGPQRAREYGELVAEQHVPGMELVDIPSEPEKDTDSIEEDTHMKMVTQQKQGEVCTQLKQQRVERAAAISQSQLLTDNDFQQLRVKQAYANVQPKRVQSRDMKVFAALEEERGQGELLSEEAITTIHSKLRRSKEERVAASKAGREIKVYGRKRPKLNPHSSTSNEQKAKSKSFTMMRQKRSIRAKRKRSFRDRQIALRNALLKRRKK